MTHDQPRAARFLEQAILFNFVIHAVAMASMVLLLVPGLPGGRSADIAGRAAYVAAHPWPWRLGWFPWQLTALADLLLGLALVCTKWIPRWPARLTLLVTLAALVPDQGGQFLWITRGVQLAQQAVSSGDFSRYLQFETVTFKYVAAWGCAGYLAGAIGWSFCLAGAGTWSRRLTFLSIATWGVFAVSTLLVLLPAGHRAPPGVAAAGNAAGFILLQIWLIMVGERVLRRSRPDDITAAWNPWRSPGGGVVALCVNAVANSRFARLAAEWLMTPALDSDIRDVVYIGYIVEGERLQKFVPWGLELQRLGPDGQHALFSILTFQHGHFGPRCLGRLRLNAPSPVQSNWRIYLRDPKTGSTGVYFVTTAINHTMYALASRLISEGVSMHLLKFGSAGRNAQGEIEVAIDPGTGSAPDLRATLRETRSPGRLPPVFAECFRNYREFLGYCVPQDRALASQPWYRRIVRQEITLGIPLETCIPLEGTIESMRMKEIVGDAAPVCFAIPGVKFRFDREW